MHGARQETVRWSGSVCPRPKRAGGIHRASFYSLWCSWSVCWSSCIDILDSSICSLRISVVIVSLFSSNLISLRIPFIFASLLSWHPVLLASLVSSHLCSLRVSSLFASLYYSDHCSLCISVLFNIAIVDILCFKNVRSPEARDSPSKSPTRKFCRDKTTSICQWQRTMWRFPWE